MSAPENEQLSRQEDLQPIQGANLSVVDEADASPEVKRLYQQFRDVFGRPQVPGILQCFATHPPLLEHMIGLAKDMLFTEGALGRQNKELISAFVSAKNGCAYCLDSHAYSFRMYGGDADATKAVLACNLDAQAITPEQRSLLQFAEKITISSCSIGPADIEAMRVADWDDSQIAEAIHVTALFASFNRVVNSFGLPSQELMRMFEKESVDVESR
jgi:uncharacterized peroxidase-related enzyme